MSLKIGLLSYRSHPYSGGQGIYVKHLSKALAELGHEVDVISGQPYPELDERVNLVKLPSLNIFEEEDRFRSFKMNYLMNPLSLFEWLSVMTGGFPEPYTYGVRVNRYLKKRLGDYQIIHDNQSLSYALLHIQQNFPLVTTIHHPITRDHKLELENAKNWKQRLSSNRWHGFLRMQKKVAPSLKAIITPSHSSKIDISNEFSVNKDFIDVVHNGIDTETFKPNDNKKRIKNRIITTASADVPLKGLKYLINALPKIISLYPDTELVVIGKAKNNGETMKLIKKLNLLPHIHFKSNLKEEDIVDLYASAELAVIPSLYEGFGFGAGEAMSCGVPLISTLSGGLEDIVKGSCYEIEPGSSVQIENAVIDLFDNEEEMKRVALLGRKRILEKFNWRQAAKGYLAIYEREITRFSS
ncbi:MAG: glycosyltransferase family 4 protein [Pseudomonadota bacterium]|nr:glycosyltransferase family 4 protein [Pseudomonadota bacterium]|tara:strand:- start:1492 stop:2727 length:1236 start_codon:yes stop_codon:yes gene_type:complete